jgi:hypothetical protein
MTFYCEICDFPMSEKPELYRGRVLLCPECQAEQKELDDYQKLLLGPEVVEQEWEKDETL